MPASRIILIASAAGLIGAACAKAQVPTRFEAEEVVVNKEVIIKDKMRPDLWTLWTTDKDAEKKWSGGAVIRSPEIKEDRSGPEDGAPVLQVLLPMPANGVYDIHAVGISRPIGLSLDGGKTWRRQVSPLIAEGLPANGTPFPCSFDDAFAHEKPEARGATYLDYFFLTPHVPTVNGVKNPDFEGGPDQDPTPTGWTWWSRNTLGNATWSTDAKSGQRAAIINHPGDKDWAFSNNGKLPVSAGQRFAASAWIKIIDAKANSVVLQVVASKDNKLVTHSYAKTTATDSPDWQKLTINFTCKDDADAIQLRFIGYGQTQLIVDACKLDTLP